MEPQARLLHLSCVEAEHADQAQETVATGET